MILRVIGLVLAASIGVAVRGQEVMPPAPSAYFNDYASLVSAKTAETLNRQLEQFERTTSNQILVAIYPSMQSGSSVEDYTERIAESWRVGQKAKSNGAVLFIFAQSHQIYLQVGYGLEPVIPDALARRIISNEITPAFRKGDYDDGVSAGVSAIMAACQKEYRGNGSTVADSGRRGGLPPVALILIVGFIIVSSLMRRRASVYQNGGRRGVGGVYVPWIFPGGGGGFGGGGGGGGGGGFSGGGGSFGGGGAGGSW